MKIGIDAKWFFSGNPSGKVVVRNLLEEFLKISGHHQIFLFLKREERDLSFPFNYPNVRLVYVWGKNNQISNLFYVRKTAIKLNLDVVLYFYFAPLFTNIKRIVFIFDAIFISEPGYFTLIERIYFSTIKFLASKADMILTISKTERLRLLKYRFRSADKIEALSLGVQNKYKPQEYHTKAEVVRIRTKYNLPERFILYIGRMNVRKNILNMFRSISYLEDKNIKLVLGGKYDRKAFNLPEKIKELKVEDRVIYLGYVEDMDLPVLYSLATVFCYVSFDEGFGMPPLESLASGVPVVAANAGSLPEVCGDAGVYCDPYDPTDIAHKIDSLLSNQAHYEKQRLSGIEIAKQYNWEKSAQHLLEVFENVVNRSI
jgi:glycosyltransferase involved in cell wall biosynthesis